MYKWCFVCFLFGNDCHAMCVDDEMKMGDTHTCSFQSKDVDHNLLIMNTKRKQFINLDDHEINLQNNTTLTLPHSLPLYKDKYNSL